MDRAFLLSYKGTYLFRKTQLKAGMNNEKIQLYLLLAFIGISITAFFIFKLDEATLIKQNSNTSSNQPSKKHNSAQKALAKKSL